MSLDQQIEEARKKLDNLILLKQNEKFIRKYKIDNLDKISNLKIDTDCQQLDDEEEYSCNFTYKMTISYDFKVSNNKVINVNFKVKYTPLLFFQFLQFHYRKRLHHLLDQLPYKDQIHSHQYHLQYLHK